MLLAGFFEQDMSPWVISSINIQRGKPIAHHGLWLFLSEIMAAAG
jgi:hypothetical protein